MRLLHLQQRQLPLYATAELHRHGRDLNDYRGPDDHHTCTNHNDDHDDEYDDVDQHSSADHYYYDHRRADVLGLPAGTGCLLG